MKGRFILKTAKTLNNFLYYYKVLVFSKLNLGVYSPLLMFLIGICNLNFTFVVKNIINKDML